MGQRLLLPWNFSGGFARDFDGEYLEFGYATSVSEVDIGLSVIFANDELIGEAEESLVFSVGKTFDFCLTAIGTNRRPDDLNWNLRRKET